MFGICESHEFELFEFRLDEFPVFDDDLLFLFDEYGDDAEDCCADVCVELFLLLVPAEDSKNF